MAKKRGLAANRGLDALLGSIKKEKQITASALQDDIAVREQALPADPIETKATVKTAANAKSTAASESKDANQRKARTPRTINKNTANGNRVNLSENN